MPLFHIGGGWALVGMCAGARSPQVTLGYWNDPTATLPKTSDKILKKDLVRRSEKSRRPGERALSSPVSGQ